MSTIQTPTNVETETKKQEEVPVVSNEMEVDSKPPTVPDEKPVLDTAAPALASAVVETEAQTAEVVSPTDKIEPVVQTEGATETTTPPAPIAKETSVEDKKVEDKVATAVPAGSSPKKERKGIFARITGILGISSPEKKDKVHKTEAASSKAAAATTATDATKADTAVVPEASTSTATAPAVVSDETVKPAATEDVIKLTDGVNGLDIVEELKKEIVETPVVATETTETAATLPEQSTATTTDAKRPEIKSSPSTPKMHRRISARIGQYIDTRFGDKRKDTASPPPVKKDAAVALEPAAGEGNVVDEVKTDSAPVLAPPISVAPLEEVTAPVEAQTETQVVKPVATPA